MKLIHGIVEVFSPDGNKSEIDYDPDKPDTLQSILDWSKTARDLNYKPQYDYITMLRDMKKEMETEPMAKLWGTRDDYEKLYADKV